MSNKTINKFEKYYTIFFLVVIFSFMLSVFGVLVSYTFNIKDYRTSINSEKLKSVEWTELYPFNKGVQTNNNIKNDNNLLTVFDKYESMIKKVESYVEKLTTDYLVGYHTLAGISFYIEKKVGWEFPYFNEYNGTIKINDEYLTCYSEPLSVESEISQFVDFSDFCREQGINILYVQAPTKVSKNDNIDGVLDYSNKNADEFLDAIKSYGIDVFDFRDIILDEDAEFHSFFYKTDHHWKAETGLWASKIIVRMLNDSYGFNVDLNLYSPEKFNAFKYEKWCLGSLGKKVTLINTEPEDFELIYPVYNTELHYQIPDKDIDVVGDFSVTYDMSQVDKIDYYNKRMYSAYNHGNHALVKIENMNIQDDKRILVIRDSFCDCVVPFLALGVKNVEALDLRYFTGSVRKYVEESKPDVVIVMYSPAKERFGNIDWNSHTHCFDFR